MEKHTLSRALVACLACAAGAAFAQNAPPPPVRMTTPAPGTATTGAGALSEDAIKADIAMAGYQEVSNLHFDDGVWQAKARGGDDHWTRIKVGPTTGKVYEADAPSRLDQDEIQASLTTQGYQNIHDVEFEDGLWSADAEDARGNDVNLLVDPDDGSVVAVEPD